MQLLKACWLALFCAAVGAYAMAVDQSMVVSPIPAEAQDPSSTTAATTVVTSPSTTKAAIISTLPIVVTTTTTTSFYTTTARGTSTLYLARYSARDTSFNNTGCDATHPSSTHTITAVQTNRCQLFPGMSFNSTDGYYAIYSTDENDRFYVATGCDYACMGCQLIVSQTLGVCATSLLHPHNESWLLTQSTCEGGIKRDVSDLADNELSIVHYPSSSTCQFNYNGQEEIINLGPADRRCLNIDGVGVMVQSNGDKQYTLWWGCDLSCMNCKFIRPNVTFDTCMSSVQTGMSGTINIMPTRRLSSCAAEDEKHHGWGAGAIVAVSILSVVLVAALVVLGVWLYKRRTRARYEPLLNRN